MLAISSGHGVTAQKNATVETTGMESASEAIKVASIVVQHAQRPAHPSAALPWVANKENLGVASPATSNLKLQTH